MFYSVGSVYGRAWHREHWFFGARRVTALFTTSATSSSAVQSAIPQTSVCVVRIYYYLLSGRLWASGFIPLYVRRWLPLSCPALFSAILVSFPQLLPQPRTTSLSQRSSISPRTLFPSCPPSFLQLGPFSFSPINSFHLCFHRPANCVNVVHV